MPSEEAETMNRDPTPPIVIGRYALYDEIAAGGMATVHIGRLLGPVGFSRTVAVKRMHANLAKDPEFVSMFLDEARLAARIRHPNVIGTLDVVALSGELFLVMEYVHGESLFRLMKSTREAESPIPLPIVSAIMVGVLDGLHAAHEATNEREEPLGIVHRDVSPHNIIVGAKDGLARVLDFGIAKAADRAHSTRDGQIKGKLSYMAPEQLASEDVDRRADVYSASVVLWEAIAGRRLFAGDSELKSMVTKVLSADAEPPSRYRREVPPALDEIVLRGLEKDAAKRTGSTREMARALQKLVPAAPASEVAEWVESIAGTFIDERARRVALIEQATPTHLTRTSVAPPSAVDPKRTEGPTLAGTTVSAKRRVAWNRYLVVGGVAAALVATTVLVGARHGPASAPAADASSAATLLPPPSVPPDPSATESDDRPVQAPVPTASSGPVVAPAPSAARAPSAPAKRSPVEAPRRRAPEGSEFDHVMDSRK
jgi:eukaryotic-like serine/threonine-protein kinase